MRLLAWPLAALLVACSGDPPPTEAQWNQSLSRVSTETVETRGVDGHTVVHQRPYLRDAQGRYTHIRGINVSGSHKAPPTEDFPSLYPLPKDEALAARCRSEFPMPEGCIPSKDVSYIGRPFPLEDADKWFGQLASMGFNSVRLLTNWESVQPFRPGTCAGKDGYDERCHDLAYLDYFEQLIQKARAHGIYVLIDVHQDVFSRHLFAYYNESPPYGDPGSLEQAVLSLFPPYTDWVRGHGAPRWVVETCLPEKKMDSPYWGAFRALGALKTPQGGVNPQAALALANLFSKLAPEGEGGIPEWVSYALENLPGHFDVDETSDYLPWTFWPLNAIVSLDADRCFAAFFAGKEIFPELVVDTDGKTKRRSEVENPDERPDLEAYLQGEYLGVLRALARRGARYDNVIGYDLMNEPVGTFLMLTAAAAYIQAGGPERLPALVNSLLGEELGPDLTTVITGLSLLPPDTEPETLQKWGLADVALLPTLDLNLNFDANYLQPFFEKAGQAVQEEDPNAIIWFEPGGSIRVITGSSPHWDAPLTRPQGIRQLVFAPHWYPDIYPTPGFNISPRSFNADEWLYRDFTEPLAKLAQHSESWLGNIPVVFGEFGTYFNYGGIEASIENDYQISAHILNAYYEAFETLGIGNMVWCFSADNDKDYGELWNHEDFSVVGPDGEPRAAAAFVRPNARATSGKLIQQHFVSQYHFWDPIAGTPRPDRTYTLEIEARETEAPTEVFVPRFQYPDGFYVYLSDGLAYYDDDHQLLYWYPTEHEAGGKHTLKLEPPLPDREALGWSYFFQGDRVLVGQGGVR